MEIVPYFGTFLSGTLQLKYLDSVKGYLLAILPVLIFRHLNLSFDKICKQDGLTLGVENDFVVFSNLLLQQQIFFHQL